MHEESYQPKTYKKFYENCEGGLSSIDGQKIYYLGIIDIFTEYNAKKKVEHFLKSLKYEEMTVSCVPPQAYARRFVDFIEKAMQ